MRIEDEGKRLRSEVAKLRPDKHRRYPEALRRQIMDWVGHAMAAGMSEPECSKAIGVKTWRLKTWRAREAREEMLESASLALVQVETPVMAVTSSGVTLVAPSGHRVEGLSMEQVVVLLREIA